MWVRPVTVLSSELFAMAGSLARVCDLIRCSICFSNYCLTLRVVNTYFKTSEQFRTIFFINLFAIQTKSLQHYQRRCLEAGNLLHMIV